MSGYVCDHCKKNCPELFRRAVNTMRNLINCDQITTHMCETCVTNDNIYACADCLKTFVNTDMYVLPNDYIYCRDCVTKYTSGQEQIGKHEERYKNGVEVPWFVDDEKIVEKEEEFADEFLSKEYPNDKDKFKRLMEKYDELNEEEKEWVETIDYEINNYISDRESEYIEERSNWLIENTDLVFVPYELSSDPETYRYKV